MIISSRIDELKKQLFLLEGTGQDRDELENHELVVLTKKALRTDESFDCSFLCLQFKVALQAISNPVGRIEWPKAILHYAFTVHFQGGERTYQSVRGKGYQGQGSHGRLVFSSSDWSLFLPGVSTLRSWVRPMNPYLGGCENWIQCIKRSFEKSNVSPVVILAFDEMEVLKGLVRCNHHQAIFGGAKQISLLERITVDPNNVELISFVFQIHIIAITGEATFPLAFFPTVKANHSWTFQTMCHVIGMVERMGFVVVGTTSDGWSGVEKFKSRLENKYTELTATGDKYVRIRHSYDAQHMVRNMRNLLFSELGVHHHPKPTH